MGHSRRLVLLLVGVLLALTSVATVGAAPIGDEAFARTWARTDEPVRNLQISRTWMWGPEANTGLLAEPYAESPGGQRMVQYFDKSRMEVNFPGEDHDQPWYVTNGLLAHELITGWMQVGSNAFEYYSPAAVNVAGDPDDPDGPTYASFNGLMEEPPLPVGAPISQRVDRNGVVTDSPRFGSWGVTAAYYVPETNHTIASPFWEFMTGVDVIWQDGITRIDYLFPDPFYATGFPLTEAYWTTVRVGGEPKEVLVQVFERRVLTYTPENPLGWQVEAGNVGQHYYNWRYGQLEQPLVPFSVYTVAWVEPQQPSPGAIVTVYGLFERNGQPVEGVPMTTTWRYRTSTSSCSGVTGPDGIAQCSRDTGRPTPGYPVQIDVHFTWGGQTYYTQTGFVPR